MNRKVSIITPCYNSEKYIEKTIKSVQSQTYENWEMLIVDDKSTDNSVSIIKNLSIKDSRIKLFSLKENMGAAHTRNYALERVSGDFVAFLDSDDLWKNNKLEKQLDFMIKNNAKITYTSYDCIDEEGVSLDSSRLVEGKVSYSKLLKNNVMGCLTVMFDVKYFSDFQMPLIRKRQDFALWLKLLKQVDYAYALEESLALYRIREISVSSNKIDLLKWNWKLFREIEKFSILRAFYYLIFNVILKLLKK
ncbi:glycosyltransferase family 2 protein [Aureivirga sp. CE67]|uniref:glycosyltransferase family 2 protein n=1 Tax=Aureivirga sp. CE67 TaxID=1788983 RepID=UPI0018CA7A81|nr:glycosyltransferase family 2 protein [Aureivirga sp. CE67]